MVGMLDLDAIVHPDYARMLDRYRMARAFSLGGLHVLKPDYPASVGWSAVARNNSNATGDDPGLDRDQTVYAWTSRPYESFLWKHRRELDEEFTERHERAIHVPLFQSLINIFSAGILRKSPTYGEAGISSEWRRYTSDVDLCGTDMSAFRRHALGAGLAFGRVHAISDRPDLGPAESLGEQLQRGERPYSYLVTPLEIPDWEQDEFGEFNWVRVAEPFPIPRAPTDKPSPALIQYRVWYRDGWELYAPHIKEQDGEITPSGYELTDGGVTNLGRVPIRTLNLSRASGGAAMGVESPLSDALDADRYLFNAMSERDESERSQSFAILFVPGQPMGPIDIGHFRAIGGEDSTQAPQYISPPTDMLNGKQERIERMLWLFRQYEGAGRGVSEFSKEERSGEALNIETEDKRNQMSLWASALQEFENGIYQDWGAWNGAAAVPSVAYPESFDIKSISTQVQELISLASSEAGIVPRPVAIRLAVPIVERILRDQGETEATIFEIKQSMNALAVDEAQRLETSEPGLSEGVLGTVGGLSALMDVITRVQAGEITEDSAQAVMVDVFGVPPDSAIKMLRRGSSQPPTEDQSDA